MYGKDTQPRKTQGTLHVLSLEGEGCYPTGGLGTIITVRPLLNAHAVGLTG